VIRPGARTCGSGRNLGSEEAMDGPDLWEALRQRGLDADDPDVRAAVRTALKSIESISARSGEQTARRCAQAIQAALAYQLRHPDTQDMSSFEADVRDESDDGTGRQ
jgi:hypothetical protein